MSEVGTPAGWCVAPLGEIAAWGAGGTPSRKNSSFYGGDIPWVKTGDLGPKVIKEASESITQEGVENSSAKLFPSGSVAFAMYGATIGKTSILGIDATTNQACAVGQPLQNGTTTDFLYYLLRNEKEAFIAKGKGGAQPNISQTIIKAHDIQLPPLAEQKEIAARLDNLLAQVDSIKTRLDAIPSILKRFRQSVLAAAVSGKLTEDWREANSVEDSTWKVIKVADLVDSIEAGKNLKCIEIPPDSDQFGIVKISAVTWGVFDEEESKTLPDASLFLEKRRIGKGDFLISRANTIELLGSPVIVENISKNLMLSDKVLRFVMPEENKPWLNIFLKSSVGRRQIESRATGNQQSMRNIGQKALLDIDIPKPVEKEQEVIVEYTAKLFAFADQIETQVKNAQTRVNKLTQSILAKAFRGELTADWRAEHPELISGENSAQALLERIKAEQEKLAPKKKGRKKRT